MWRKIFPLMGIRLWNVLPMFSPSVPDTWKDSKCLFHQAFYCSFISNFHMFYCYILNFVLFLKKYHKLSWGLLKVERECRSNNTLADLHCAFKIYQTEVVLSISWKPVESSSSVKWNPSGMTYLISEMSVSKHSWAWNNSVYL